MRIAACFMIALAMAGTASAQTPVSQPRKVTDKEYARLNDAYEYWMSQQERYEAIARRARELYPDRRNTPLRELNISDDEIREVQAIKEKYLPSDYVNISPVVTDCPCEEGPTCTAQVYVVATLNGKERGLQLSRFNDRWEVGMVQQWWLRYQAITWSRSGDSWLDFLLHEKAVNELYEEFPRCVGTLVPAEHSAAAQKPEPAR